MPERPGTSTSTSTTVARGRRGRPLIVLGVTALVLGSVTAAGSVASAVSAGCAAATRSYGHGATETDLSSPQDIDDDGSTDLVVGVPAAHHGAGAIDIRYAFDHRHIDGVKLRAHTQRVTESSIDGHHPHAGDAFGSAAAFVRADSGYCDDLAIGAPGAKGGRGEVVVAYGSPEGLSGKRPITITGRTRHERFGSAIIAAGRNLWIAAPNRRVSGVRGAGAVDHYRISGRSATRVQTLTAATPVAGGAFGSALALSYDELVIGEPGAHVAGARDAGAVELVHTAGRASPTTITQNTPGVSGKASAGNHFGASVSADNGEQAARKPPGRDVVVVVGAPGSTVSGKRGAGLAYVFHVPHRGHWHQYARLSQDTHGVPGHATSGAHFGAAVYVGGVSDYGDYGSQNVAVGAPGADVGPAHGAGVVDTFTIRAGETHPVKPGEVLHRGAGGHLGGTARSGDALGSGLSAVAFTDELEQGGDLDTNGGAYLTIAVPDDNSGAARAGSLTLAVLTTKASAKLRRPIIVRDSTGAHAYRHYGTAATTVGNGSYFVND